MLEAALKKLEGLHTFAAKRSAEQLAALPEASPSDWAAGAGKVVEQWLRYQRSKTAAIVADTELEVAAAVGVAASAARAEKQGERTRGRGRPGWQRHVRDLQNRQDHVWTDVRVYRHCTI